MGAPRSTPRTTAHLSSWGWGRCQRPGMYIGSTTRAVSCTVCGDHRQRRDEAAGGFRQHSTSRSTRWSAEVTTTVAASRSTRSPRRPARVASLHQAHAAGSSARLTSPPWAARRRCLGGQRALDPARRLTSTGPPPSWMSFRGSPLLGLARSEADSRLGRADAQGRQGLQDQARPAYPVCPDRQSSPRRAFVFDAFRPRPATAFIVPCLERSSSTCGRGDARGEFRPRRIADFGSSSPRRAVTEIQRLQRRTSPTVDARARAQTRRGYRDCSSTSRCAGSPSRPSALVRQRDRRPPGRQQSRLREASPRRSRLDECRQVLNVHDDDVIKDDFPRA